MIGVFMGDDESIHLANINAVMRQSSLRLDTADTRVEQQFLLFRLDIDAVAVATGLQRDRLHFLFKPNFIAILARFPFVSSSYLLAKLLVTSKYGKFPPL